MWDWYFFVIRIRISIFSIRTRYDVFYHALRSSGHALLSDNVKCYAFWIHNHSSSSFSLLIVVRHMRLYVYCMWMRISIFSIPTRSDVFYLIYRTLLSDDENCYAISIRNHSSSMFSSSLVVRHIRLVLLLEFHYFITHKVWCILSRVKSFLTCPNKRGWEMLWFFMSSSFLIAVFIVDSRQARETGTFRHANENFNIFYTHLLLCIWSHFASSFMSRIERLWEMLCFFMS